MSNYTYIIYGPGNTTYANKLALRSGGAIIVEDYDGKSPLPSSDGRTLIVTTNDINLFASIKNKFDTALNLSGDCEKIFH